MATKKKKPITVDKQVVIKLDPKLIESMNKLTGEIILKGDIGPSELGTLYLHKHNEKKNDMIIIDSKSIALRERCVAVQK